MSPVRWYDNGEVEEAIERARSLQKALLIDLWHPTCLGCAKLFATTYQTACVQRFLDEQFVCIKYNTTKPNAWFRELNGRVAHVFHPHLIVADARLTEGRRFVGYLPPAPFVAQLRLGLGILHMFHRRFEAALLEFARAGRPSLPVNIVSEATYWRGVAAYRVTGSGDQLASVWRETAAFVETSDWAERANCLDVSIPDDGFDAQDVSLVKVGGAQVVEA